MERNDQIYAQDQQCGNTNKSPLFEKDKMNVFEEVLRGKETKIGLLFIMPWSTSLYM